MKNKRPVNLDLRTIKQPLPALTSITHRITGVIMFVGLIFMFWAWDKSLSSAEGFEYVKQLMQTSFLAKFITWGLLSALAYHCVAGIKHLIMDLDIGVNLVASNRMSQAVIAASVVLILLAGVWVW